MDNQPLSETGTSPDSEWVNLLDQNLSKWEKWIGVPHTSVSLPENVAKSDNVNKGTPLGLNNDPLNIFSMIKSDGEDVLKIHGEIYGGLTTLSEYEDYHLQVEFKWGEKKWEPRLDRKRDSGLLYHCTGKHGAFWNVWMRCLEFQIQENDMGDFYPLAGANAYSFTAGVEETIKSTFKAGGERTGFGSAFPKRRNAIASSEELPHGAWNTLELYTVGGKAIHVVNGKVVNLIEDAFILVDGERSPLERGKIQLQSEAADAFFRRLRIRGIQEIPAALLAEAGM